MDKEVKVEDFSKCYVCGSPQKRSGNSLHCWDIEYECGCSIWGALGDESTFLSKECSKK